MLLVFIGLQTNAHKRAGDLYEFFLREQTVLRVGVAWSEDP